MTNRFGISNSRPRKVLKFYDISKVLELYEDGSNELPTRQKSYSQVPVTR